MTDPREQLLAWRSDRSLTKAAAGELLGCDPTFIGLLEAGKRYPGRRIANTIQRVVGIPTTAWDEVEDAVATEAS